MQSLVTAEAVFDTGATLNLIDESFLRRCLSMVEAPDWGPRIDTVRAVHWTGSDDGAPTEANTKATIRIVLGSHLGALGTDC